MTEKKKQAYIVNERTEQVYCPVCDLWIDGGFEILNAHMDRHERLGE